MATPADPDLGSTITDSITGQEGKAIGVIAAVAAVAFGIKAVWVTWRAGSKAVGKAGS